VPVEIVSVIERLGIFTDVALDEVGEDEVRRLAQIIYEHAIEWPVLEVHAQGEAPLVRCGSCKEVRCGGLSPIEWFSLLARASMLLSQARREYGASAVATLESVRIECPPDDVVLVQDSWRKETAVFVCDRSECG